MCQLKNIFPNFIKSLVMKIKDLDKYTNAEKILLAEELWESVSKEKLALSDAMKQELDRRISLVEEDKTEFYTWEDVKNYIRK
jgi:putative addiction module component (TIGR02574 family)